MLKEMLVWSLLVRIRVVPGFGWVHSFPFINKGHVGKTGETR